MSFDEEYTDRAVLLKCLKI